MYSHPTRTALACLAISIATGTGAAGAQARVVPPTVEVLHSFSGGADGGFPTGGAIAMDPTGNIFGMTVGGGAGVSPGGMVYELSPPRLGFSNWTETALVDFHQTGVLSTALGYRPLTGIVRDTNGNLYGGTEYGGAHNSGTVFKIFANGSLSILRQIPASVGLEGGPPIMLATDPTGDVFGAAGQAIFKIAYPSLSYSVRFNFDTSGACIQGASSIIRDASGNLWGTSLFGSASISCNGAGVIYKIAPNQSAKIVASFPAGPGNVDNGVPNDVTPDGTGGVFGTTSGEGGDNGQVFRWTPSKGLVTLHIFNLADGYGPRAGLAKWTDGNYYGVNQYGGLAVASLPGQAGWGTIFKVTPTGALTVLYKFTGGVDGAVPTGTPVIFKGYLYGTTLYGGVYGKGTVFRFKLP